MKHVRWFAWMLAIWLLLDFTGLLLSVISTYFYFGWAGTPQLVPKIFLIALLAFSAPLSYRILLHRWPPDKPLSFLLPLLLLSYGGLMFFDRADTFAWGVVGGTWLSGLTLMALLRQVHWLESPFMWFSAVLSGFSLYLGLRVANHGLALFFSSHRLLSLGLLVALAGGIGWRLSQERTEPVVEPAIPQAAPGIGMALGLLIGISVGLIYNLHIWSAQQIAVLSGMYLLSFGGAALLVPLIWYRLQQPALLISVAVGAMACSLYGILYAHLTLGMGLLHHFMGCWGLGTLWLAFCHRYMARVRSVATFPTVALQSGFLGFLLVLALFLLKSNPTGFWIALVLLGVMLLWPGAELDEHPSPLSVTYSVSFGMITLLGLYFLPMTHSIANTPIATDHVIRVLSSNIRYGWTDDYRFAPQPHRQTLEKQTQAPVAVDIIGFQEMNKGHTSGAYMDLQAYYAAVLGNQWRYGDANFGFGNALWLHAGHQVLQSEVRRYQAKDILRRSCLWNLIKLSSGQEIEVFVTHLSHLPPPNPVREAQAQELMGWLKQTTRPWILIGDFNALPTSREVQAIVAVSHPMFRSDPTLLAVPSFPSLLPRERIDYIFYSREFQPLPGQAQEVIAVNGSSDHNIIATSLVLQEASPGR